MLTNSKSPRPWAADWCSQTDLEAAQLPLKISVWICVQINKLLQDCLRRQGILPSVFLNCKLSVRNHLGIIWIMLRIWSLQQCESLIGGCFYDIYTFYGVDWERTIRKCQVRGIMSYSFKAYHRVSIAHKEQWLWMKCPETNLHRHTADFWSRHPGSSMVKHNLCNKWQ